MEKIVSGSLSEDFDRIGNIVEFGSFNGAPVRWRILDTQGQLRLLVSDDVVARMPYNEVWENTFWNTSSLRKWLNHEFFQKCFTFQERIRIINSRIENKRSPKWESEGGPETIDKIFILDIYDVEKYFPQEEDRAGMGWWWVRTPGSNILSAAAVYKDGSIYDYGINLHYPEGGVRPAMWVRVRK